MRSLLNEEKLAIRYSLDVASRVGERRTERHKPAKKKAHTARASTQKPGQSSSRRQTLQRKATSVAILPTVAPSEKLHSKSLSYRSAAIKPIFRHRPQCNPYKLKSELESELNSPNRSDHHSGITDNLVDQVWQFGGKTAYFERSAGSPVIDLLYLS